MKKGIFITFEGPDCAGKTTQIKRLQLWLENRGCNVICTREPGGTLLAENIRALLLQHGKEVVSPAAELLLFGASRAQHLEQLILPHLDKGGAVICDRFYDSTTAYQGYGRGLDMTFISAMHSFSTKGRKPDITILIDLPLEESRRRMAARQGVEIDRMEEENNDFHQKVRNAFLDIAAKEPERVKVINGMNSIEQVEMDIRREVEDVINRL